MVMTFFQYPTSDDKLIITSQHGYDLLDQMWQDYQVICESVLDEVDPKREKYKKLYDMVEAVEDGDELGQLFLQSHHKVMSRLRLYPIWRQWIEENQKVVLCLQDSFSPICVNGCVMPFGSLKVQLLSTNSLCSNWPVGQQMWSEIIGEDIE